MSNTPHMRTVWLWRRQILQGFSVKDIAHGSGQGYSESTIRKYTKAEREKVRQQKKEFALKVEQQKLQRQAFEEARTQVNIASPFVPPTVKEVLEFMERHDGNGSWMEWYEEIREGDSVFDKDYVLSTLDFWYRDSGSMVYWDMFCRVKDM